MQILEGDDECEMIIDGQLVKVANQTAKKKRSMRPKTSDKSEDMMAFLERKRVEWNSQIGIGAN